ncbi:hypothetical protein DASC09_061330 [Saccharomycopsis crataegensis]|uniref:Oligomycin resistance ATP-dependent permease YOR1 n=1 Tax=Saccharomycopsis crataegensis TaxID=43959 RepID=A0AAV5QVF5_9ASCO|nr:hypothetical protein DASC09_061330 [Saccharomycopsis crataegensis]
MPTATIEDNSSKKLSLDLEQNAPKLQKHALTPLLISKKVPPFRDASEMKSWPRNFLKSPASYLFFWWLIPLMNVGYKRTVNENDLFLLPDNMKIETLYKTFEQHLQKIEAKNKQRALRKNPSISEDDLEKAALTKSSIPLALLKTLKLKFMLAILWKIVFDVASVLSPLLTKKLIDFVENRVTEKHAGNAISSGKGVGYAIGVASLMSLCGFAINHFFGHSLECGIQTKAIITKLILEKSFTINSKSKQTYTSGKISSLMGTDISRLDMAVGFSPFLLTSFIPIVIIIALLIVNLGVSALSGIAVFLAILAIMSVSSKSLLYFRKKVTVETDERVSLIREVLISIKMIKYYSWETPYHDNIKKHRNKETKILFNMQAIKGVLFALGFFVPTLCSMVSFVTLNKVDPGKSVASIFSSLSLFSELSTQLILLPLAASMLVDGFAAIQRVKDFVLCPDEAPVDPEWERQQMADCDFVEDDAMAIQIKNAEFEWESIEADGISDSEEEDEEKSSQEVVHEDYCDTKDNENSVNESSDPTAFTGLHNVNLNIKKGEFIIVTGVIGSGKSSLLNAISGTMKRTSGVLKTDGSLLFCDLPWIQSTTIRQNICFTNPYVKEKYDKVVEVCSLVDDFKIFQAGDLTSVGERGVTLSGGQKSRINLARAVYNDCDIVLLDDVLSAVDSRVGKSIVENCLLSYLGEKTRVLVTHQLSLIHNADRVIYLNTDKTISIGTVDELISTNEGFADLMKYGSKDVAKGENNKQSEEESKTKAAVKVDLESDNFDEEDILIKKEDQAVNRISFEVYLQFLRLGTKNHPILVCLFIVLQFIITTFCTLFVNTWLSFWTAKKWPERSDNFYIGIYIMLCFVGFILNILEFITLAYVLNHCAREVNLKAIKNIFQAPMSFLDSTPVGRLMNRFTKDTDALDNQLGDEAREFLIPTAMCIGIGILCIIYLPWMAIVIPVLSIFVATLVSYYQATGREVKRLEAVNRSFVYNNFEECLAGMSTIKEYGAVGQFLSKNDLHMDTMNNACYTYFFIQRFMGVHLDNIGAMFVFVVAALCVTGQFNMSASSTGLVVSYVIQACGLLTMAALSLAEVENVMNSAERLVYYGFNLPKEEPGNITANYQPVKQEWLEKDSSISFKNVNLRYRDNLPLVLRNLSLSIKSGEKIGICGRTGAGKSSIMTALYRLTEIENGAIEIDGLDISTMPLATLRSQLCIIPQDPVLFKGTIRSNLDPFHNSSDDELWDALRRSGLVELSQLDTVKKQQIQGTDLSALHKFHLDQPIQEEGKNLSLGERQLLALARALVKKTKILILDEATSSVDYKADAAVNHTIRTEFEQCTTLCIAHRLNTIIKFDRIMVLDKGELKEFDTPKKLFMSNGIFREMCDRSNITEAAF